MRGCNVLGESFSEGNLQCMAECTKYRNMVNWTSTKIGTYLEDVIECSPICKMSGGDGVEVFQTTPSRKYCHSTEDVIHELNRQKF
jgi:hypothetical protein